jgi:hypothetical protein
MEKRGEGVAWPAESDKQIPHRAKNAGIPFGFAQGALAVFDARLYIRVRRIDEPA